MTESMHREILDSQAFRSSRRRLVALALLAGAAVATVWCAAMAVMIRMMMVGQ
jgi:hypothetical protein